MEIRATLWAIVAQERTLHLSGTLRTLSVAFTWHVLIELIVRPVLLLLLSFCYLCVLSIVVCAVRHFDSHSFCWATGTHCAIVCYYVKARPCSSPNSIFSWPIPRLLCLPGKK